MPIFLETTILFDQPNINCFHWGRLYSESKDVVSAWGTDILSNGFKKNSCVLYQDIQKAMIQELGGNTFLY